MSIKSCSVCQKDDAKYKCPKCKQFYCSVPCCNKHKECCTGYTEPKTEQENQCSVEKTTEYDFPTDDTVPIEKLDQLRYNEKVKDCLRDPQVRDIIKSVLNDKDPTKAVAKAMTEAVFVQLADACLEVVEPPDEEKPC